MASDHEERISDSFLLRPGPPAVYQLRTEKEAVGTVTRVRLGRRDDVKPKKSILLVGETGAGKSTVVDVLLNYSLGVKFEDQVWFQMTEEEPETSAVIVYQIPDGDTLPFSLSVIDTPGFGSGGGIERDAVVRERLLDLFQSEGGVQELHAVVLVTKASENRLTDRLQYVYDAVMSLLGRNMDKNTVVLVTHSDGTTPANLLQTLEAGSMKCARDGQNQPVHFLLGGNQSSRRDAAETAAALRLSWDFSYKHMDLLSRFLSSSTPQTLVSTVEVLSARVKLAACVQNLQERIQQMELKRSQISQTKEALKNQEEELKKNAKFTVEVDEVYLGQRPISGGMWGGIFYSGAVSCCGCKRTCHYPCTMAWSPETCSVMRNGCCSVCHCHVSAHVKQEWIYESKTRRVQKTLEDVKRRHDSIRAEMWSGSSLLQRLEEESRQVSAEKDRLTDEAYYQVVRLEQISLSEDALSTAVLLDFLTEQVREKKDKRKVQKLEEVRGRMNEKRRPGLRYAASAFRAGQNHN